jgi:hypothetical protein
MALLLATTSKLSLDGNYLLNVGSKLALIRLEDSS